MRLRLEFAEARLARLEAEEKAESQNSSSNKADGEITRVRECVDAQRRLTEPRAPTPCRRSHRCRPSPKPVGQSSSMLADEERQQIIETAEATRVVRVPHAPNLDATRTCSLGRRVHAMEERRDSSGSSPPPPTSRTSRRRIPLADTRWPRSSCCQPYRQTPSRSRRTAASDNAAAEGEFSRQVDICVRTRPHCM